MKYLLATILAAFALNCSAVNYVVDSTHAVKDVPHTVVIRQGNARTGPICNLDGNAPYSTEYKARPPSGIGNSLGRQTQIVFTQGATVCTFPNSTQTTVTYK